MQAPILLSTGAIARYPLERRLRYATRRVTFADFSQQTTAHLADDLGAWKLNLDLLTDAEASDWLEFYRSMQGGAGLFTFLDPWDNCLKHSEAFENAAWIKGANLVVGKNYLTRSEEFDHADWIKAGSPSAPTVTANNVLAPDGTQTAEKIDFPATGAGQESTIEQSVFSAVPVPASQKFTWSVLLRADSSITIKLQFFDGVNGFQITANLTTSWQRFEVTATTGAGISVLKAQIVNQENQAAKTVYSWGAQFEYGAAASDYTKTTTAATELLIADPFWLAAPSSAPGASLNLNSEHAKRARQVVFLATSDAALYQDIAVRPGGSGSSRTKGIEFTLSAYFKRQAAGGPDVRFELNDVPDYETNFKTVTPGASWAKETLIKRFSSSNNSASVRSEILSPSAAGTMYVFGWQLDAGGTVTKYKKTTAKSGVRPNCRFAEDEIEHAVTQFDHNNLSQLVIQEWNG